MYLVVGLGNPGKKYEGSRHNLGFQVVEKLSQRLGGVKPDYKHQALVAVTSYMDKPVILAQPLTYMNLSGRAVNQMIRNYHIDSNCLLVVYDDLDLPAGSIRLRGTGGSGGHRGLQSIIDILGTNCFPRLRVGIGSAPDYMEPAEYVLMPVGGQEKIIFDEAVARSAEAVLHYIEHGLDAAMNIYNCIK
jgi:PTH1 family peptidyl-tRNA hydrolase